MTFEVQCVTITEPGDWVLDKMLYQSQNTVKPVFRCQLRDRVTITFEGRWLLDTGQFCSKVKYWEHKILTFKDKWLLKAGECYHWLTLQKMMLQSPYSTSEFCNKWKRNELLTIKAYSSSS